MLPKLFFMQFEFMKHNNPPTMINKDIFGIICTHLIYRDEFKFATLSRVYIQWWCDNVKGCNKPSSKIWDAIEDGRLSLLRPLLSDKFCPINLLSMASITARRGHVDLLKFLLGTFRDPEPLDSVFSTACMHGHSNIAKLLLADSRVTNYTSALWTAVVNNCVDIISELLDRSPLMGLAFIDTLRESSVDILNVFLKHPNFKVENNIMKTIIDIAVYESSPECIKILLNDGRFAVDCALLSATAHRNYSAVKLLLADSRVDPSENSQVVIHTAVEKGDIDMVRILLTDPRVDPSGAIDIARLRGHDQIVDILEKAAHDRTLININQTCN